MNRTETFRFSFGSLFQRNVELFCFNRNTKLLFRSYTSLSSLHTFSDRHSWFFMDQLPSWKLIWTVPPSTKETCRPEVRYIRQDRSDACQLLQPFCHAASCRSPPPRPRGSGTRPSPTGREDWRWPPGHHLMAWGLCGGVVRLLLNRRAAGGEAAPEKGRRRAERTLACEEQCAGLTPWDLSRVFNRNAL